MTKLNIIKSQSVLEVSEESKIIRGFQGLSDLKAFGSRETDLTDDFDIDVETYDDSKLSYV